MCGATPCVRCRGPRRREYRRAKRLADRLTLGPDATSAVALLNRPQASSLRAEIDLCRAAYRNLRTHPADEDAEFAFDDAVRAVGAHVIDIADPLIDQRIHDTGCQRQVPDPAELADASARLRRLGNEWGKVHARVRRDHKLAATEAVPDHLLLDEKLPAPQRQWRKMLRDDYIRSRAQFLQLQAHAAGRDEGWGQRTRIRTDTYLEVIGELRPLGPRSGACGEVLDHFPTAWLNELTSTSHTNSVRAMTPIAPHHMLTHRAEEAVPALAQLSDVYARRLAGDFRITVHGLVGTGADGRSEALAVGAEAVFTGRFGGLVGDGYRTPDDAHRALVLGAWAAL